ncbi:serine/threonine-protein kinase [Neorhodopirellula lusitana]|uniref:serine/threonine-protein kinase n=1 Tax=Neorhodopirellula lusitana TaxID=445327 RepID=UPI00384B7847
MSEPMPVDMIFREAALASNLVSEQQWRTAALEVKRDRTAAGATAPVEQEERAEVVDQIAAVLIRDEVLTEYQAQQLRAGRTKLTLGPYIVTDFLGQGGMGQVFAGYHEIMGRRCAIKVLPLDKSDDEARESFHREIRLQASLDCPYLVRAFDAGREGSVHFLVTEFVPGTDLRRLVKENGKLSVQQAASIVAQAAAGLAYAHESGLIHRDIKPANILVTPEGHAKVADVGLAALAHSGDDDDPRAGKIVGTADYLSPEQIRTPHLVGPQSDLYSLGCTLYYCATGKVPFPNGDTRSKCKRHLTQAPWDPRKHTPELPSEFVEIIADMIEKDTRKRVQTAAEVVRRLSAFAAPGQDQGDQWMAELGLELDASSTPDYSTDRLLGAVGVQRKLVPTEMDPNATWRTSSSGQSGSVSGLSDVEDHEQMAVRNAPPVLSGLAHAIPNQPSAVNPSQGAEFGHVTAVPPPIAEPSALRASAKMVTRTTLIMAILTAAIVGAALGVGATWLMR